MDDKKYAQGEDAETEKLVMQLWNREQEEEAEIPKKKGAEGQGHLKPGKDKNGGESKLTSDETHKESESANRERERTRMADGAVDVMVNEQEEVLTLPMQPMALEAAREAMESI